MSDTSQNQPNIRSQLANARQQVADDLYDILQLTSAILHRGAIAYCGIAGTLLGLARHGGIIPWDDDADIVAMKHDADQLRSLGPIFDTVGLTLSEWWFGFKVSFNQGKVWPGDPGGVVCFLHLDIYLVKWDEDRLQYSSMRAQQLWPQEYLRTFEWHNRSSQLFIDFPLVFPAHQSWDEILRRLYGDGLAVCGSAAPGNLSEMPRRFVIRDGEFRAFRSATSIDRLVMGRIVGEHSI